MNRWQYNSVNFSGNIHDAVAYINREHSDWDVVAIYYGGGVHTIIVWREIIE